MTSFLQMLCGGMAVSKVGFRICTTHTNTALSRAVPLMQETGHGKHCKEASTAFLFSLICYRSSPFSPL